MCNEKNNYYYKYGEDSNYKLKMKEIIKTENLNRYPALIVIIICYFIFIGIIIFNSRTPLNSLIVFTLFYGFLFIIPTIFYTVCYSDLYLNEGNLIFKKPFSDFKKHRVSKIENIEVNSLPILSNYFIYKVKINSNSYYVKYLDKNDLSVKEFLPNLFKGDLAEKLKYKIKGEIEKTTHNNM